MPRAPRIDVGDQIYHVLNRVNGRIKIFDNDAEFKHFETLLELAQKKFDMRIIAYTIMPNHWHLVLYPRKDGDIALFMQWLTLTHTQQYRARTNTVGYGHLYQGRYKSFLVSKDSYLFQLIRYVEQNPLRAGLVQKSQDWKWGSAYKRYEQLGEVKKKKFIVDSPVHMPTDYYARLNQLEKKEDIEKIRVSVDKGSPLGEIDWVLEVAEKYGIVSTLKKCGRPKK